MGDQTLTSYGELIQILELLPVLVREKRRRCGLSLRAVERATGISNPTICNFENGEAVLTRTTIALLRWVATPDTDPAKDPG